MAYATVAQLRAYINTVSAGTFTAAAVGDTLTFTDVTLMAELRSDRRVTLSTTDTLPAGLAADTIYYVQTVSNMTCQLSATEGGSAIDITDAGTGTHTLTLADNDDTFLEACIDRAESRMKRYLGFSLYETADTTRNFDSVADVDGLTLYFDTWLASITTITNGDGTELETTDYVTQPRNDAPYYAVKLKNSSGYVWETDSSDDPEDAIEVEGLWAYYATLPDDVVQLTCRYAAWLYRQRDSHTDIDRVIVADGVVAMPGSIPADIREDLDAYRWRTV